MGLVSFAVIELLDEIPKTINLTSTGTITIAKKFTIPNWIPNGKIIEVKVKISYTWGATADGKIRVRNDTDGVDIAVKTLTGGESSNEEDLSVSAHPDSLIGKTIGAYVDVDVAGGTGESASIKSITLLIGFGV